VDIGTAIRRTKLPTAPAKRRAAQAITLQDVTIRCRGWMRSPVNERSQVQDHRRNCRKNF
jgi:hypothetical protein